MTAWVAAPATTEAGGDEPGPGRYEIDPAHTVVGFVVRHLVVTKVRGRFLAFSGTITVADPAPLSHVEIEIQADSISTGIAGRDAHLRSADFFAVESHPLITFCSTNVSAQGPRAWIVDGDLTIRGTTRPVALDVALLPPQPSPSGTEVVTFRAATEVLRTDFGVDGPAASPSGAPFISSTALVELFVQATRSAR